MARMGCQRAIRNAGDLIADEVCYAHVLADQSSTLTRSSSARRRVSRRAWPIRHGAPVVVAMATAVLLRHTHPDRPVLRLWQSHIETDATGPLCPGTPISWRCSRGRAPLRPIAADALLARPMRRWAAPGRADMGACGNPITATGFCARCTLSRPGICCQYDGCRRCAPALSQWRTPTARQACAHRATDPMRQFAATTTASSSRSDIRRLLLFAA